MPNDARITAIVPVSGLDAAVDVYEGRLGVRLELREIPTLR